MTIDHTNWLTVTSYDPREPCEIDDPLDADCQLNYCEIVPV